jgi:hypothetical protein
MIGRFSHPPIQLGIGCAANHCLCNVIWIASAHDETFNTVIHESCRAAFMRPDHGKAACQRFYLRTGNPFFL